ncbi:hypothetical protein CHISP_0118 [Chitinispirillum alkaliphilum]|nr:hypothetical protein CHISP_0118 [Chitinispirillum alkaliphilum]
MKRFLVATGAVAAIVFSGCGLLDADKDDITINNTPIGTLEANTVDNALQGRVSANVDIDRVEFEVRDTVGNRVDTNMIRVLRSSVPGGNRRINFENDLNARVNLGDAVNGEYVLRITVTAGSATTTKEDRFTVINGRDGSGTPVATETITVAGHGHATMGSSFNLDDGEVMLSSAATQNNSGVDLVYTFSGIVNSPVLMTPVFTKEESGIGAFSGWVNPHNTRFHKVNVNFDEIETAEEIEALFNSSHNFQGRVAVDEGDVLVVETTAGNYVLIRMNSVSSDAAGTATIKSAK